MTSERSFLLAILSGDLDARLIFADWLTEQGREDEAALWWHGPWPRTEAFCELSPVISGDHCWRRKVRLVSSWSVADVHSDAPTWFPGHLRRLGLHADVGLVACDSLRSGKGYVVQVADRLWYASLRQHPMPDDAERNAAAL